MPFIVHNIPDLLIKYSSYELYFQYYISHLHLNYISQLQYNKRKYPKVSDSTLTENNILDRIKFFLEFKHWSIYKLSKESRLSYSSLNNIFNRNTCPSVMTLEKICNGLQISLSEFFAYENNPLQSDELTYAEQEIVNSYRSLSVNDKKLLEAYLNGLCKR